MLEVQIKRKASRLDQERWTHTYASYGSIGRRAVAEQKENAHAIRGRICTPCNQVSYDQYMLIGTWYQIFPLRFFFHSNLQHPQVEVQTQTDLWSDPVERTTVCSQKKLQGLDGSSSALQSGPWSGDGLIRGQFGLKRLWSYERSFSFISRF